ncbi:Bug family tripartite tricarboxylate transporter substrate binding protein [Achromobacter aegrifaciens]
MKMNRLSKKRFLFLLLATTFFGNGYAADFPAKPINIVVPYPPGGTTDILARIFADQLSKDAGKPVIVVNKAGAGGNVGASMAAKSNPDGYTLLLGTVGTQAINKWLYHELNYDPEKDFKAVAKLASVPNLLVANPAQPYKSVSELVDYAKSHPGEVNFASAGTGGSTHLAGELFKKMAAIDILHVPYKGSAAVVNDLIGGQVQITFDNLPSVIQYVRADKLRAIAITSPARSDSLPDVPTIAESGLPGYDVMSWFGVFVPAGTPLEARKALEKMSAAALANPGLQEKIQKQGGIVDPMTGDAFEAFVAAENKKWRGVIDSAKISVE